MQKNMIKWNGDKYEYNRMEKKYEKYATNIT